MFIFLILICLFTHSSASDKKIVICGIAQNVGGAIENSLRNMEMLGQQFADHKIIIYENNSTDLTPYLLEVWAENNPHAIFITEKVPLGQLSSARTERIADARNKVLAEVQRYIDFDYVVMADLDFTCDWPIQEIVKTVESQIEWDCVTSNGIDVDGYFVDKYALRSEEYPLGPELLGFDWWVNCKDLHFVVEGDVFKPIYSGFGGLAIYKMSSLKGSWYAGNTTREVKEFYKGIFGQVDRDNAQWKMYLQRIRREGNGYVPVIFTYNTSWEHAANHLNVTCCEHVGLHAAMWKNGFRKIFVNPQMIMRY